MKIITLAAFAALLMPLSAFAGAPHSMSEAQCKRMGQAAEIAMQVRQTGVSMPTALSMLLKLNRDSVKLAEAAYSVPYFKSVADQDKAIGDFRDWFLVQCYKDIAS